MHLVGCNLDLHYDAWTHEYQNQDASMTVNTEIATYHKQNILRPVYTI